MPVYSAIHRAEVPSLEWIKEGSERYQDGVKVNRAMRLQIKATNMQKLQETQMSIHKMLGDSFAEGVTRSS